MTNTRKYLIAHAASAPRWRSSPCGPAFALDCDAPVHHTPSAPAHSGLPGGLPGGGGGTVCINEGGAYANGIVANSPGVLSGNQIQIPINIQTNICGNSLSIL